MMSCNLTNKSNRNSYHIGLWRYAREFYRAAKKLTAEDGENIDIVAYYLYCHSIELILKAVLSFKGYKEENLKKIGHDLKKAWKKVVNLEPSIRENLMNPEKIEEVIGMVNCYYKNKEFEYIKTGAKIFPTIKEVHDATEELLISLRNILFST